MHTVLPAFLAACAEYRWLIELLVEPPGGVPEDVPILGAYDVEFSLRPSDVRRQVANVVCEGKAIITIK